MAAASWGKEGITNGQEEEPLKEDVWNRDSYPGGVMKFTSQEKGDVVIIVLEGRMLGGPDASLLSDTLRDFVNESKNRIVLNMVHVDWMNSSGLGILIAGLTTVRNSGGDLKLIRLTKKVKELLRMTKLDRVFEIFENEDEAVGSFS